MGKKAGPRVWPGMTLVDAVSEVKRGRLWCAGVTRVGGVLGMKSADEGAERCCQASCPSLYRPPLDIVDDLRLLRCRGGR